MTCGALRVRKRYAQNEGDHDSESVHKSVQRLSQLEKYPLVKGQLHDRVMNAAISHISKTMKMRDPKICIDEEFISIRGYLNQETFRLGPNSYLRGTNDGGCVFHTLASLSHPTLNAYAALVEDVNINIKLDELKEICDWNKIPLVVLNEHNTIRVKIAEGGYGRFVKEAGFAHVLSNPPVGGAVVVFDFGRGLTDKRIRTMHAVALHNDFHVHRVIRPPGCQYLRKKTHKMHIPHSWSTARKYQKKLRTPVGIDQRAFPRFKQPSQFVYMWKNSTPE